MFQQNISQSQQQILSVDQQQSLRILAFTNQELDAFLNEEYLQNPLLECDRDRQSETIDSLDSLYEYASSYKDHYIRYADEDSDRRGDIRARESSVLRRQLKGQLTMEDYSSQEWKLIDYMIDCLDEKGFFVYTAEEVASAFGCAPETVEKCLQDLRQLEPVGIFSADISQCLIKQLEVGQEKDEILIQIIRDYFPDLLHGNLSTVTRALGITTARCRDCIRRIGQLNPRPIMNSEGGQTEYLVPDILASREGDCWKVVLNDGWMGDYKINDYYIHMMRTSSDPELREYFREKLERARLIITSIERRRSTIIRIAERILDLQSDFFLHGGELKPMTMDMIAGQLDISTSTVSRAIRGKYLQYHRPVLMRDLFLNAVSENTDVSPDNVCRRIGEIVRGEDRSCPLSDDKIAGILRKQGLSISRRTVAKYRQRMGIPESRVRAYL